MRWRWIGIVILMGALFPSLYGQRTYSFGVKAGISLSNQSYRFTPIDYVVETMPLAGPVPALFVETFKGDHFSFQMDVFYARKGSSSNTQSVTVNHMDGDRITVNEGIMTTSTFSYLSLAPMARYKLGQDSLHPYFLLGPRLDMLLYYKTDSAHPLREQNHSILGLSCGVGLEFMLQHMGLFAELQFQPDLSPVTNVEPLLINNNMISFTLGISWSSSE